MARTLALDARGGDARARRRRRSSVPSRCPRNSAFQQGGYRLSDVQAQRILEMQLQRLTGLEQDKIVAEYREVMEKIADLLDILAKPERITQIIGDELAEVKARVRRQAPQRDRRERRGPPDRGPDRAEDVVVTLSHGGYIKSQPLAEYRAQKRGGRGKQATTTKEDDFIEKLFIANTHDYMLCFSNRGKRLLAQGLRGAAGQPHQPRQADRQPAAAGGGRENHRGPAGEGVRRGALRVHGDRSKAR